MKADARFQDLVVEGRTNAGADTLRCATAKSSGGPAVRQTR